MDRARTRIIFACLGVTSVMTQVILMRRLMSVFSGNELTLGAALSGWMIWTGLGSAALGRAADRLERPREVLAVLFILAGLLLPATVLLTYTLKTWLGYSHGEIVGLEVIIIASVIITAPVCFALGFAFNLCCKIADGANAAIGRVYLWEALGSALAGAVFSFILAGRVHVFQQVYMVTAVFIGAAALSLRAGLPRKVFVILFFLSLIATAIPGDRGPGRTAQNLRWGEYNLLEVTESRYGEIAVTESAGEVTFFTDGVPAFTYPLAQQAEYPVHLPLSMCRHPERILLIGGGLAPLADELKKYAFERLDYIQIDPALTRLEERFIPETGDLISDPRIRIYHEDGRRRLKIKEDEYDAVILNLGDPETAQVNRFFTEEFFRLVKSRLRPGGVFGLTAGTSGNYLSDGQALLLGTIRVSLEDVFDKVVIIPLGVNYLVAGDAGALLTSNPGEITESLRRRGIQASFVREYFLQADLSEERLGYVRDRLESTGNISRNLDMKPRGYLLGLALWLEQAQPSYRGLMDSLMSLPAWSLALVPFLLLAAGAPLSMVRKNRAAAVIAVGVSGFVTMASEVVVMISFQVIHGYVYHLLGLIVAVFMVGLAAGARAWEQAAKRRGDDREYITKIFIGSLVIFTPLPLILSRLIPFLIEHQFSGAVSFLLLASILFIIALLSGFIFPASAALFMSGAGGVGRTAGWINSSDHFGAALGAFVISAFAIPLFGLGASLALCFFMLVSLFLVSLIGLGLVFRKGTG